MKLPIDTLTKLTLAAALVWLPACDKGGDDKKADDKKADDKKADDKKADDKAEAAEPEPEAKAEPKPEGAASELAELDGDGRVEINVDASGYHPAQIKAPAKSKVTLAFTRTTEAGCGQELVLASLDIKKELPLNEAVEVEVEVPETGELGFACGMNMYKGAVVPKS